MTEHWDAIQNHKTTVRHHATERCEHCPKAKPWILFVPAALIDQTIEEAKRFSSFYNIYVMGDTSFKESDGVTKLTKCDREHFIFDSTKDENARTLVIASLMTFDRSFGPNRLLSWYRKKSNNPGWKPGVSLNDCYTIPREADG